jgi:hypothetical protein
MATFKDHSLTSAESIEFARRLAAEEGILSGVSGAAARSFAPGGQGRRYQLTCSHR